MTKREEIRVEGDLVGQRLDGALAALKPELSRNQWQVMISSEKVLLDGIQVKPSARLEEGSLVVLVGEMGVPTPSLSQSTLSPTPKVEVLYLDDDVIVVNKPAGISVHRESRAKDSLTIAEIMRNKIKYSDETGRAGIVHRLDKDTSGVMILARSQSSLEFLQKQFKARKVKKHYLALVYGELKTRQARIELPIGRHHKIHTRMAVLSEGKSAVSEYTLIKQFQSYSLIDIELLTGRTHQIRVHMSYLGNPVVGDKVYSKRPRPEGLTRQFLHAKSLTLILPNGTKETFEAPLPGELEYFLRGLV